MFGMHVALWMMLGGGLGMAGLGVLAWMWAGSDGYRGHRRAGVGRHRSAS